jgi:hypothetical protein
MAIITTVGATTANSYITVAEYETFWTERNVTISHSTAAKESELVKAADYLNRTYNYIGERQYRYQGMEWPRLTGTMLVKDWPIDPDTVPQDIKDAQAEMAYLIHGGATPFSTVSYGAIKRTKSKAGSVESETEYTNYREVPRYVAIEGLLAPYTEFGGAQIKVLRA